MKIFTKIKKMLKFGLDTDRGVYKSYWEGKRDKDAFIWVKVVNAANPSETHILAIEPIQFELAINRGKVALNFDPISPTLDVEQTING